MIRVVWITICVKCFYLKWLLQNRFQKGQTVCLEAAKTSWLGCRGVAERGSRSSWKVLPKAAFVVVVFCGRSPYQWFSEGPAARMLNVHQMLDHLLLGGWERFRYQVLILDHWSTCPTITQRCCFDREIAIVHILGPSVSFIEWHVYIFMVSEVVLSLK